MKDNRRKFIKLIPDRIKRKLQVKYAFLITFSYFFLVILIVGLIYLESALLNRFSYYSNGSLGLSPMQWGIIVGFFMIIFGYLAILSLFVINFSHRIIGPIYRIEMIIKEVIETGKAPVIKLRKHDELQETIDLLNKFFEDRGFKKSNDPPLKNSQGV